MSVYFHACPTHSLILLYDECNTTTTTTTQGVRLAAQVEHAKIGEVFEAPVEVGHTIMKFIQSRRSGGK